VSDSGTGVVATGWEWPLPGVLYASGQRRTKALWAYCVDDQGPCSKPAHSCCLLTNIFTLLIAAGNHDAWWSLTNRSRQRRAQAHARGTIPSTNGQGGNVCSAPLARQLEVLGQQHIGFSGLHWGELGLSLVGGRPFSKGGRQWSDVAEFYRELYGVSRAEESSARIVQCVRAAPTGAVKVLAAHTGPSGLGCQRQDICGVDWVGSEGDHGDPDLASALTQLHQEGVAVPAVVFGHMHHVLHGGGLRNMVSIDEERGTVYLNAAVVPRIKSFPLPPVAREEGAASAGAPPSGPVSPPKQYGAGTVQGHHFLVVELHKSLQIVMSAKHVWVGVLPGASNRATATTPTTTNSSSRSMGGVRSHADGDGGPRCVVVKEENLFSAQLCGGYYLARYYRAHCGEWGEAVMKYPRNSSARVD
jgi:uncharacterized protein (TIGR04168 family)